MSGLRLHGREITKNPTSCRQQRSVASTGELQDMPSRLHLVLVGVKRGGVRSACVILGDRNRDGVFA